MLTMLLPQHALDEACRVAMKDPRMARDICLRILATPGLDEQTERGAFNLAMTLRRNAWGRR